MVKSKTMSVRIDPEIHEMVIEECNIRGCKANEFLSDAITHELEENTVDLTDRDEEPESTKILSNLNVELGKVYDENGNIVGTISQKS